MRNAALTMWVLAALVGACRQEDSPGRPIVAAPTTQDAPVTRPADAKRSYPLHRTITATVFWVGERPGNIASAWDERWSEHFSGYDDPDPSKRLDYRPRDFVPRENPFYVALPYNDIHRGRRRADASQVIPWASDRDWGQLESMCKNRWVRIVRDGRICYAQWEDVGPFNVDDAAYVFGDEAARPRTSRNQAAGIDLSPAVRDYLGLDGMDAVDWQFVEEADVPDGPWRDTVTTSQIHWE